MIYISVPNGVEKVCRTPERPGSNEAAKEKSEGCIKKVKEKKTATVESPGNRSFWVYAEGGIDVDREISMAMLEGEEVWQMFSRFLPLR
jgi:hypothetical protein